MTLRKAELKADRELQRELAEGREEGLTGRQESGFEQQTGERLGREKFTGEQAGLQRDARVELQQLQGQQQAWLQALRGITEVNVAARLDELPGALSLRSYREALKREVEARLAGGAQVDVGQLRQKILQDILTSSNQFLPPQDLSPEELAGAQSVVDLIVSELNIPGVEPRRRPQTVAPIGQRGVDVVVNEQGEIVRSQ